MIISIMIQIYKNMNVRFKIYKHHVRLKMSLWDYQYGNRGYLNSSTNKK